MLYLNKRSPSEELASVHNPNSPSGTSTWHHSLDDQKMTEVVAYPQPQHLYHFGGSSHRLLAPAPEHKSPYFSPDLYREMPVYPVGYQTSSQLPRSPPEARSASVSSISSVASHGTPNMSSSRTMSPVTDSSSSDSMASPPVLTRTYNPPSSYHHTQHHHTSQALPSSLIPAPSHYLHAQVAPPPPMSLYPSMPVPSQRTTTYPPSSSYGYHQHMGHPYPAQQPMHNYHQLPMQTYQPVYAYTTSAQAYPSLSAGTILPPFTGSSVMTLPQIQRHEKAPIERLMKDQFNIMMMIQSHLDYFDVTRAQMANRFFRDHFDPSKCPEEDKIRCVMYAEINFKRFWPNNTSSAGRGGDKDDGKHPGSFGCYHCFKVKKPENFELFRWKNDLEDAPDSNDSSNNNDQKSQRGSVSSAVSSRQQQQQQQQAPTINITQPQNNPPLSPSTSSQHSTTSSHNTFSLTSNPHYDPSVTRSSLAAAAASSRNQGSSSTRRTASTGYSSSDQSPRIQETWGIRRFCIDCGIKKKFYRPGVLIELHKEKNAVWVCDCWVTHKRPQELDCKVCKKILPLSTPNRRMG
ncbi:hypothetical protein QBC32DRAFT_18413 [Pseudoneurospora amorphoporcata]|uniref:Uncharacterized protein n=1 Tax=Pseudoneurospora amorphoporcata TaxID=241081 RepID=A0AAN6NQP0_9PEZI|nr:hypothetical protein QBC32DRAFT_18413 [Pseudoneurospora amorphoporcata]